MIQLNKQYRLDNSRDHELILQQFRIVITAKDFKPTGEVREEWIDVGYYTKLETAFNAFLNRYASKADSVAEVLERITEVRQMFKDALNLSTRKPEVNLNSKE